YTDNNGNVVPSVAKKMEMGRTALDALAKYRALKDTDPAAAAAAREILEANVQYMGYGYLNAPEDVIPPVGIVYWSFRFMIGLGMFIALVLALVVWFNYKDKLSEKKWLLWGALICIPLVYICGESGWIVAEVGRQPWTIQGLLPVNVAISDTNSAQVMTTFFLFLAIFALFLIIEIRIMLNAIKKGPSVE
ncbi:MAG: cytochrome ubiquinol oxidase subunit I, partial [Bacteroidia bacterium]|nr:cytochrome ubiquinol oxidase subunit I [Bacteroidia bacterium]